MMLQYNFILETFLTSIGFGRHIDFFAIKMFDIMDQLPIDKDLYRTVVPFVF